jgi:CheY-like chemotaxis protein
VAVAPPAVDRLRRILTGHDVTVVATLDEALRRLTSEKFDIAIIGVYFDESHMFELLQQMRSSPNQHRVPVVCVLGVSCKLSDAAVWGVDQAVEAMAANAFLDLRAVPDDMESNARVRSMIDYLIGLHSGLMS